jgi:hypothetical protein
MMKAFEITGMSGLCLYLYSYILTPSLSFHLFIIHIFTSIFMVFQLIEGSCNKRAVYVQLHILKKIYLILPLMQAVYFVDDINV